MAGKEMIFIAALFVVVQSTPRFSFDQLSCPSVYSLKTAVKENECTKNEDCRRARYICCENQNKVNVCAEGVLSQPITNLDSNKKATVESESTNLDKSIPVPTASTDNDDDVNDD
uniref:Venom protein Ci-23a n=1 Tax=Chelonus inanitus TaxID=49201 RepID=E6ZCJ1_9HYME|nr:venom protein Ci-23a [Chelonus inanitus]